MLRRLCVVLLNSDSESDVVDRNRNGIPDDQERKPRGQGDIRGPLRQDVPFNGSLSGPVRKESYTSPKQYKASAPVKGGLMAGLAQRPAKMARPVFEKTTPPEANTGLPSFLSNLLESLGMVGTVDAGDGPNFDPLRQDARNRGSEYDAKLAAMYNQLQGAMRQDGAGLQQSYQGAIDQNAQRTDQTEASIQGASDAAAARNLQQLQALGIGEAAGNIVAEGRDLNSDTARAVQDASARGQISGNNLSQNQQSAAQHNTNLVGAAGLEGNLQRARVQSELSSLLAQYDMQEEQGREEARQRAQQAQQSALSQAMGLAGAITDDQWQARSYEDELARLKYEQEQAGIPQPNKISQSMDFLKQLMSSPQFKGQDIEAILPYIQALGGIGKLV